jgi:hypothetical protein
VQLSNNAEHRQKRAFAMDLHIFSVVKGRSVRIIEP